MNLAKTKLCLIHSFLNVFISNSRKMNNYVVLIAFEIDLVKT